MYAILLAAGYATRLYPLTKDTPKSLLKVAGKPIIEHIIRKIEQVRLIKKVYIITNDRFEAHFKEWASNFNAETPIEIINDGSKSNEDRMGAVGDMNFAITTKKINDDVAIVAGDNLFDFSLSDVASLFKKRKSSIIVLYDVKSLELARHYGIVEVNNNLIVNFKEKPVDPKSSLASTGIYMFPKKTVSLIKKYVAQGNDSDKMGNFIEWLHKREDVYSYITDKQWYDIGNNEQLEKAKKYYTHGQK